MRPSRHLSAVALLPIVALCAALGGCKRGLQYVASGDNGEKFYVDPSTIQTSGDERTFTLVAVEAKPKVSFGAVYDRSTTDDRVSCTGNTFVLGEARGYKGDSLVFDNPGESPVSMRPGGVFESVHRYVCGR